MLLGMRIIMFLMSKIFSEFLTIIIILLVCALGGDVEKEHDELLKLRNEIDRNESIIYQHAGDQATPGSVTYLRGFWQPWIKEKPIIVLCMRFDVGSLGNFLGTYFDSIACAAEAGLHFIGVKKRFLGHEESLNERFYDALPSVIAHPHPVDNYTAITNINEKCQCKRYCWRKYDPWSFQIPLIRHIITNGINLHLAMRDMHNKTVEENGLMIYPTVDLSTEPVDTPLPLIPDVAIHYRCSDNIYGGMGLMAFRPILKKIPPNAKYIYVFTEYGGRLSGRVLEQVAPFVLKSLFDHLVTFFPNATVVVKKGGNELTVWAQFLYANMTYCSPSTYCFWPAIARNKTTFMPGTAYIAALPGSRSDHAVIHPSYHWVEHPRIYNNFTKDSRAEDIISTLSWDVSLKHKIKSISSVN